MFLNQFIIRILAEQPAYQDDSHCNDSHDGDNHDEVEDSDDDDIETDGDGEDSSNLAVKRRKVSC